MKTLYEILPGCVGTADSDFGLDLPEWLADVVPTGMPRGLVSLVFGESGNFKTTLKANIVHKCLIDDKIVMDWSLEDGDEILGQMYLARETGIPYRDIAMGTLDDEQRDRLDRVIEGAYVLKRHLCPGSDLPATLTNIEKITRKQAKETGLDLLVVDYAQQVTFDNLHGESSERRGLEQLMKLSQQLAKELNIAVLVVSQINKMGARKDCRPVMDDLFGSSFLKFASKLAIAVYRPWKYEREQSEQYDVEDEDFSNILELWVRKYRYGDVDICRRVFVDLPTGKVSLLDRQTEVDTDDDEVPF